MHLNEMKDKKRDREGSKQEIKQSVLKSAPDK